MKEELWGKVRAVPRGLCTSYGALGRELSQPVSGLVVGRWLESGPPEDVPWWRVVAKDGSLPIAKRNPYLAEQQRARLEAEGVAFDAGCVRFPEHWFGAF